MNTAAVRPISSITGAAATFANNVVNPIHYLADGNSDEQLRLKVIPGVDGEIEVLAR